MTMPIARIANIIGFSVPELEDLIADMAELSEEDRERLRRGEPQPSLIEFFEREARAIEQQAHLYANLSADQKKEAAIAAVRHELEANEDNGSTAKPPGSVASVIRPSGRRRRGPK